MWLLRLFARALPLSKSAAIVELSGRGAIRQASRGLGELMPSTAMQCQHDLNSQQQLTAVAQSQRTSAEASLTWRNVQEGGV